MINLSTSPDILLKELAEDFQKAIYWAKHKDKDALDWARKMKNKSIQSPEVRMGPDYTSSNGNRWLIFFIAQPVGRTGQNAVSCVTFCYYETIGSIGAFCLINGNHLVDHFGVNGCCIYTSHFFLRLSERTGVVYRSKEMLMTFVTKFDRFTAIVDDKDILEPGEVAISLAGGQGRGIILNRNPYVYEIRTFIPEHLYNNRQKATARKLQPYEETDRSGIVKLLLTHCRILMDELGYVSSRDVTFWQRVPERCASYILDASRRWNGQSKTDSETIYLNLLQGIAKQMGINNFDPNKAKERIARHLMIQDAKTNRPSHIPSLLDISGMKR